MRTALFWRQPWQFNFMKKETGIQTLHEDLVQLSSSTDIKLFIAWNQLSVYTDSPGDIGNVWSLIDQFSQSPELGNSQVTQDTAPVFRYDNEKFHVS